MASKLERFKKSAPAGGLSTKEQIAALEMAINTKAGEIEYQNIELDDIKFNPANDYADMDSEEDIAELADSIDRQGMLHNLVLNRRDDGQLFLISGSRRLRALRLLRQDPEKNTKGKYNTAMCKIYSHLNLREELIFLDAANLETRGGAGGSEKILRKVTQRYKENIMAQYNVPEIVAAGMVKKISARSARVIDRERSIEKDLIPELFADFENGILIKATAAKLTSLSPEEQGSAHQCLAEALQEKEKLGEDYRQAIKEISEDFIAAAYETDSLARKQLIEGAGLILPGLLQRREKLHQAQTQTHKSKAAVKGREQYLDKIEKIRKQLRTFDSKKNLAMIREFDGSAPDTDKIIGRLTMLEHEIAILKEKLQ